MSIAHSFDPGQGRFSVRVSGAGSARAAVDELVMMHGREMRIRFSALEDCQRVEWDGDLLVIIEAWQGSRDPETLLAAAAQVAKEWFARVPDHPVPVELAPDVTSGHVTREHHEHIVVALKDACRNARAAQADAENLAAIAEGRFMHACNLLDAAKADVAKLTAAQRYANDDETALRAELRATAEARDLRAQEIERLARFILREHSAEIHDGSAVDTAIAVVGKLQAERDEAASRRDDALVDLARVMKERDASEERTAESLRRLQVERDHHANAASDLAIVKDLVHAGDRDVRDVVRDLMVERGAFAAEEAKLRGELAAAIDQRDLLASGTAGEIQAAPVVDVEARADVAKVKALLDRVVGVLEKVKARRSRWPIVVAIFLGQAVAYAALHPELVTQAVAWWFLR